MNRTAAALWNGQLGTGNGTLTTHSSALDQTPYSFSGRFDGSPGTNPEELLAAAHAGCFTMAVCAALTRAGFTPTRLLTHATVHFEQIAGQWTINASHLELRGTVPKIANEQFIEIAADAKVSCPVSRVLNLAITLDAQLLTPVTPDGVPP